MSKAAKLLILAILGVTLVACAMGKEAAPPPSAQSAPAGTQVTAPTAEMGGARNFLGQYYDLMQPEPDGGVKKRWLKPGVNFGKYNKVMLEGVVFYLAKNSDYQGIDPDAMKELADKFDKTMIDALKDKYPIASQSGPDVVRIRMAITDLEQSRPILSSVTSVVPIGLGISIIKRGATGSWSGSGATGMAIMAIDSTTNEVIAVFEDKQHAGFTERFSKWGSAEEAFKFWAENERKLMDEAHNVKK